MSNVPSSGGVRSLLAKFENNNQNSTSPPSRGRSPTAADDTGSVRPLSKVRASFVSVEKSGQNISKSKDGEGFDKETSQRSATVSPVGILEKSTEIPPSVSPQRVRTGLVALQGNGIGNIGEKLGASSERNGTPKVSMLDKSSSQGTPNRGQNGSIASKTNEGLQNGNEASPNKQLTATKSVTKRPSTVSLARDLSSSKLNTKTSAIKDQRPVATPPKSSTTPASHRTPNVERPASSRTPTTSTPTINGRTQTPSQDSSKQTKLHSSPSTRVLQRSPTRPVRLPASMTAPTAASAAKTGDLSRPQSHANISSSPKTLTRKPSTLKADATSRLTAPTTSSLRRQPSRQSLPAHSQSPNDRPKSRVSTTGSRAAHEESFLARMMRPTASSASKVHEKIEPRSPPKLANSAKIARKSGDSLPDKPPTSSSKGSQAESQSETALVETGESKEEEKVTPNAQTGLRSTEKDSIEEPTVKHITETREGGFETVHEEPLEENTDEVSKPVEPVAADAETDDPEAPSDSAPAISETLPSLQPAAEEPAERLEKEGHSDAAVEGTTTGDTLESVEPKPVASKPADAANQPEPEADNPTEHLKSAKSLDPVETVAGTASEDNAESTPVVEVAKADASESPFSVEATNQPETGSDDPNEHLESARTVEPVQIVKETASEGNAEHRPVVEEATADTPKDIPDAAKSSIELPKTVMEDSTLRMEATEQEPELIDEGVD